MKKWLRVHKDTGIVVCVSHPAKNLHSGRTEELQLTGEFEDIFKEFNGRAGDLSDGTPKPENYPKDDELTRDEKIEIEAKRLIREQAEQSLIKKGEIDPLP